MIPVRARFQIQLHGPLHQIPVHRRQQQTPARAHGGDDVAPIRERLFLADGRHKSDRRAAIHGVDEQVHQLADRFLRLLRSKGHDHRGLVFSACRNASRSVSCALLSASSKPSGISETFDRWIRLILLRGMRTSPFGPVTSTTASADCLRITPAMRSVAVSTLYTSWPGTKLALGKTTASSRSWPERMAPIPVRSGPTCPPSRPMVWQL